MLNLENFNYMPDSYLSLLLRVSANNAEFKPNSDWTIFASGKLLEQSMMINLFDYNYVEFIDVSFIETSYQWLYIYQQFARASCIVHQLSEEVNTKGWCCFDEKGWMENLETSYLKKYALLLIKDFKKLCDFPDISASWSSLFKILHDNKYSWGEFEHPTAKTLKYDDLNQKILDENNQEMNWYDIIYLSISPNVYEEVKHIKGLRFSPQNYFCFVTSFNGEDLNQHL